MKRLDVLLALSAPTILGVWSWLTWPAHVTAVGIACLTAPLYVALVLVLSRQDADRAWMKAVDPLLRAIREDFYTGPDDEAVTEELPVQRDEPTAESPALDIAGGLRLPVDTGPPTQVTGEWREVNIGGEIRRFLIG